MSKSVEARRYHHGDLRAALLSSAEAILERHGLAGLTLRAAAREAGVSHAAPAHHFGDRRGLLSDLAAAGFHRFADHLSRARDAASEDRRLLAVGMAYIDFAMRWPALFLLMFRAEGLDPERPSLAEGQKRAGEVLENATAGNGEDGPAAGQGHAAAIAAWSIVHGLAMLLLDGRLPPEAGTPAMIEAVLSHLGPRAG